MLISEKIYIIFLLVHQSVTLFYKFSIVYDSKIVHNNITVPQVQEQFTANHRREERERERPFVYTLVNLTIKCMR